MRFHTLDNITYDRINKITHIFDDIFDSIYEQTAYYMMGVKDLAVFTKKRQG